LASFGSFGSYGILAFWQLRYYMRVLAFRARPDGFQQAILEEHSRREMVRQRVEDDSIRIRELKQI
jgi:hypothetical protein